MATELRKRSPRAPSISLGNAIERAMRVYEAEGKHPAPHDVIAKHVGYSSPSSGAAATTLATLRYYGLLERPKEGFLAASRDLETYKFAPDDSVRNELLIKWLKSPPLFAELLSIYEESLPSESNLKFELIKRGFKPTTADECIAAFRESVEFAKYYERSKGPSAPKVPETPIDPSSEQPDDDISISPEAPPKPRSGLISGQPKSDEIPIRLFGGRRAWLVIPNPFYESDKKRLIAQIDLLLTDPEENG